MMGSNGLLQFVANNHSGTFCGGPTCEEHNAGSGVGVCGLEEANSNAKGATRAAERALIIRDRPRVACQRLQDARQLEFALLDGHEESRCAKGGLRHGLPGARRSAILRAQAQHVLDLLWLVLLPATEDVGLATFRVSDFVYLGLQYGQLSERVPVVNPREHNHIDSMHLFDLYLAFYPS